MIWGILALLGPPLWLCELGIAKRRYTVSAISRW
jgi:hypothetical protein